MARFLGLRRWLCETPVRFYTVDYDCEIEETPQGYIGRCYAVREQHTGRWLWERVTMQRQKIYESWPQRSEKQVALELNVRLDREAEPRMWLGRMASG